MNSSIYPSHPSICPSTPTAADEMVFDRTTNLSGISKLFLLKFSVTLIVAQGLIANILVTTHTGEQLLLMMLIDDA
jgi:hypothetical protein